MLISNTGWTWDYIDERMTLPRLSALGRYWKRAIPPLALSAFVIARSLGWDPSARARQEEPDGDGEAALASAKQLAAAMSSRTL